MRTLLLVFLIVPIALFSQQIFMIGDAGEPENLDKTLELLKQKTIGVGERDVLIFLGDNIYPKGLPSKENPLREEMELKLIPQLEAMKSFPGRSFIVPGNHDWARGRKNGWQHAQNMEAFVTEYMQNDQIFLPSGSCPGPTEISLGDHSTLIILNTQYFLHTWNKPGEDSGCESKSTTDALIELRNVIKKNAGKHVVIAAHHPVYTYGEHNGRGFTFREHLFPLTDINKNLYVPLPIIGSIYPLFRKTIGSIQDNTNLRYKTVMKEVRSAMNEAAHVIYVAGHEHSLQFIEQDGHHYIVSGSGVKETHVTIGKGSLFAKSEQGFAALDLRANGSAGVKFWGVNNRLLFEKDLYTKELVIPDEFATEMVFSDSTISAMASKKYAANRGKKKWLGRNYRETWATPIEVDVIDLGNQNGGLKILKQGGGMATKSLRLEADNGRQYVLRSIEKYPESMVPKGLRETFAMDLVRDQTSAAHPYEAIIVPSLAEAASIYHMNPKPMFIPNDPTLGEYREKFAGTLALFEERPNKESAEDMFGAKDVEGTDDVLEALRKDNDNSIDQSFVVRNRLFDLWIGDWDRHDDQWRWAEFDKEGKGKLYRPIPRDRDQAFFINEGFIPKLASRKWAVAKIEGFDEKVRWAPDLSFNARYFDRTFMNQPGWEDWKEQIYFLQQQMTDSVIDNAISGWPQVVQNATAERVRSGLIARRKDMPRYARELYEYLSTEVEVVGTDKHEHFLIERRKQNELKITVYKRKKDGKKEQIIFERVFDRSETQEVRLYGLEGEDVFEIIGEEDSKIKLRIIGGKDQDKVVNSHGQQRLKNVFIYDKLKGISSTGNTKGTLRLDEDPEVNSYDRKAYKYDLLLPLVSVAYNKDDGLFLGGGFTLIKNKWRKEPFASKHTLLANTALATNSFNFSYEGTFTGTFGNWDLNPTVTVQQPFFINNYFGLGNETSFEKGRAGRIVGSDHDAIDYYRTRINLLEFDVKLVKKLGGSGQFFIGPGYKSIQVEQTANRLLTDQGISDDFLRHEYSKVGAGVVVDTRDSPAFPKHGTKASVSFESSLAVNSFSNGFSKLQADWSFYQAIDGRSKLVLASRVGFAHNTSSSEFFNANTLGGRSNLRGYRRTGFATKKWTYS